MNEFDDVIRLLRERRPLATELELDQIKQRVRRNAARESRRGRFMKSRLAILGMLVMGMLLSTTGAGLAITGFANQRDASVAQYGTPTTTPTETGTPAGGGLPGQETQPGTAGGVLPGQETQPGAAGGGGGGGGVAGAQETSPAATQPTRQVEAGAGGGQLPFTGYAAIPVLLGGIALLTVGLVLRRRAD